MNSSLAANAVKREYDSHGPCLHFQVQPMLDSLSEMPYRSFNFYTAYAGREKYAHPFYRRCRLGNDVDEWVRCVH
ncbi:hypothetical protein [Caballeronia temeraria]|uniref:hypothetical protein n=1 Tax=Caballeronia temeraria TaxID=1777137 RepID=UPI001428BC77|nr:hypothetical protein [Caballeronia temeraria]